MASTISFYKTLLRSDWRRLWPIPVGYTIIWFFLMPAMILSGNVTLVPHPTDAARGITSAMLAERYIMDYVEGLPFAAVCMGLLLGASLFAYLMNSRSVGLMHSLPASRTTLFFGHCLSGVVMFTASNLFIVLTTTFALGVHGAGSFSGLMTWFAVAEMETFFFFMLTVLCCMTTGWLLAVPVIFAGLNGVYVAYELLLRLQVSFYYWGFQDGLNNLSETAVYLTPIFAMSTKVGSSTYNSELEFGRYTILEGGITLLAVYTVAALAIGALALFLYRRRHSESAQDPIVFPWLRPIVSGIISTAAGLALGYLIAAIFDWIYSFFMVSLCQVICGALTAIVMEMIMQKTYKVFNPTAYKRSGAVIAFIIILLVGARLDSFGVQKYVPDPEDVESVRISSHDIRYVTLSDPEDIEHVIDIHTALLPPVDIVYYGEDYGPQVCFCNIRYELKNGTSVYRSYEYYDNNEAVNEAMDALAELDEVRQSMLLTSYSWRNGTADNAIGTNFTYGWYNIYNNDDVKEGELTADECKEIYSALQRDIRENMDGVGRWRGSKSKLSLSMETTLGSYELVGLYPECRHTIDLLVAMGVVEKEEDLFYNEDRLPTDVPVDGEINMDPNSAPELSDSSSMGIIGSADGPTQIVASAS